MNFRTHITLFNKDIHFNFGIYQAFTTWKKGITNRCVDGQFVLFLDYDRAPLDWILDEIWLLQQQYRLGDVHIFKTAKGHHAVNTEKRPFWDVLRIMRSTSADPLWIDWPVKYGKKAWTLRVSDKKGKPPIAYVATVPGKNMLPQSEPHNWVLRNVYGLRISKKRDDGEKGFYESEYPLSE